jgi:hypothetical protein
MSKSLSRNKKKQKYDNEICDNAMTFQECEIAILRKAVDESEAVQGKRVATNEEVKKIISILEEFLKLKHVICYGGTAINNILPKDDQFYDKDIEVPDYDFYSSNAMDDAIELANIYHDSGYGEVEAKAGVHHGTYKVYVNYLPIADITQLNDTIFDELYKSSIKIAGIKYASADFLRMAMFLELSRPDGDVSRWEKVHKRLNLLNKHYPLKAIGKCNNVEFQRKMNRDAKIGIVEKEKMTLEEIEAEIFTIVRDELASQGAVFFGGYACSLYGTYLKDHTKHELAKIPDFDVIVENIERVALIIKEQLEENGYTKIGLIEHAAIGEIVPKHIEIRVGKETIAFLYEPIACHNYNKIVIGGNTSINVATIDTILTFYLAFLYTKKIYYYKDRLTCIAEFLFNVQEENRLSQKGLLKRFSMDCYGKQPTMEDIRSIKSEKFVELSSIKGTRDYDEWFLNYKPSLKRKEPLTKKGKMKSLNKKVIEYSPGFKHKSQTRKHKSQKKFKPVKSPIQKSKKNDRYLF